MTQHTDLIERLRKGQTHDPASGELRDMSYVMDDAADALETQAREIAELKAQLAATARNAFEAMPHDIPQRMKDAICEETGWSGSMVSRMYTELCKAFTGDPYKANEDLDAALLEVARLRKDAALVAARERERLTSAAMESASKAIGAAVSMTIERCAQVCEAMHEEDRPGDYAYAIRALNTEGGGGNAV